MLNRCEFIGNLGRDVEVRHLQNGDPVANLSVAVTERWKKDGEQRERTEWVRAVCFIPGLVKVMEAYLRKGSKVYIAGKMSTRKYTDKDGVERYSTEIVVNEMVMLDGKQESPEPQGGGFDDSIPF